MKLVLKKDIVIPAGTEFDSVGVAVKTVRTPGMHVRHTIGFGPNTFGELMVGHEIGDPGFDEWFESEN